jgi:hypothetical protein
MRQFALVRQAMLGVQESDGVLGKPYELIGAVVHLAEDEGKEDEQQAEH